MDDGLFADERLYDYLLAVDRELAEQARRAGCPQCAGRLHAASRAVVRGAAATTRTLGG